MVRAMVAQSGRDWENFRYLRKSGIMEILQESVAVVMMAIIL